MAGRYRIVTVSLMLIALTAFGDVAMAQDKPEHSAATLTAAAMGAKVVDSIMGDLTGEGSDDALLVIDPVQGDRAHERHALEVVLMRRDGNGRLYKAETNRRLLVCGPCATTDRLLNARSGTFTVLDARTGTHAMRSEYHFEYDLGTKAWRVAHVSREIIDPLTGRELRQDFNQHDLGGITFARFDPARLPAFQEEKSK